MFTQETITSLPMESLVMPAVGPHEIVREAPAGGTPTQRDTWYRRAAAVMPYGVSSNFRYWGQDDTMIVSRANGAYLWDVDGKRYIDYRLGFGPVILGHAHPSVTQAVTEAMQDGNVYALTNIHEVQAAERFVRMTGTDMVRFTNSGAESTMHAIRIARAHTNRDRLIKFEGCYHGAHDYVMWSTPSAPLSALGSAKSPRPIASSSGIPAALNGLTLTLPFNDFEMLERTVKDKGHEIAAIIVEPIRGNLAALMPAKGWLEHIRRLCDAHGIVMIMDEVKTGFRVAAGGAQAFFGVQADLVCYAKAMANGFPIGAIAGKRAFMMTIEPGAVGQGGTYCGNTVSAAACNATLKVLEEQPIFETLNQRGTRLMIGLHEILTRHAVPHAITGVPSMFGVLIGTHTPIRDYRGSKVVDAVLSRNINEALRAKGIFPEPDYCEPWFLCAALSDANVSETLDVYDPVLATLT